MIKQSLVFVMLVCLSAISCSTDSEKNLYSDSNLIGTWEVSEVKTEESSSLSLPQEIANNLIGEGCKLLVYTFNKEGTVVVKSKLNHIEVNAGPTGLDVDCPVETDTEVTTWELNDDQLTYTNEEGEEETIAIKFEGNMFVILGEDLDADNYAGMEIVFTKR
tara:strand:+ start:4808 stop:5293 length:486 start_codon:yes stop_codon:yes gene_type:complete